MVWEEWVEWEEWEDFKSMNGTAFEKSWFTSSTMRLLYLERDHV